MVADAQIEALEESEAVPDVDTVLLVLRQSDGVVDAELEGVQGSEVPTDDGEADVLELSDMKEGEAVLEPVFTELIVTRTSLML